MFCTNKSYSPNNNCKTCRKVTNYFGICIHSLWLYKKCVKISTIKLNIFFITYWAKKLLSWITVLMLRREPSRFACVNISNNFIGLNATQSTNIHYAFFSIIFQNVYFIVLADGVPQPPFARAGAHFYCENILLRHQFCRNYKTGNTEHKYGYSREPFLLDVYLLYV